MRDRSVPSHDHAFDNEHSRHTFPRQGRRYGGDTHALGTPLSRAEKKNAVGRWLLSGPPPPPPPPDPQNVEKLDDATLSKKIQEILENITLELTEYDDPHRDGMVKHLSDRYTAKNGKTTLILYDTPIGRPFTEQDLFDVYCAEFDVLAHVVALRKINNGELSFNVPREFTSVILPITIHTLIEKEANHIVFTIMDLLEEYLRLPKAKSGVAKGSFHNKIFEINSSNRDTKLLFRAFVDRGETDDDGGNSTGDASFDHTENIQRMLAWSKALMNDKNLPYTYQPTATTVRLPDEYNGFRGKISPEQLLLKDTFDTAYREKGLSVLHSIIDDHIFHEDQKIQKAIKKLQPKHNLACCKY